MLSHRGLSRSHLKQKSIEGSPWQSFCKLFILMQCHLGFPNITIYVVLLHGSADIFGIWAWYLFVMQLLKLLTQAWVMGRVCVNHLLAKAQEGKKENLPVVKPPLHWWRDLQSRKASRFSCRFLTWCKIFIISHMLPAKATLWTSHIWSTWNMHTHGRNNVAVDVLQCRCYCLPLLLRVAVWPYISLTLH